MGRSVPLVIAALGAAAAAVAAPPPRRAASPPLARLEPGLWQVKPYEGTASGRSICLGDGSRLVQLEHGGGCSQEVVGRGRGGAAFEYSCGARGYGHTELRIQTPRSATIHTQGMVDGRPFSYRAIARRSGAC